MLRILLFALGLFVATAPQAAFAADDWLAGYANYEETTTQLQELAGHKLARVKSLGKTAGDRDVWLLTLGGKNADAKPGILVMGAVEPHQLYANEIARGMAKSLLDKAGTDEAVDKLLTEVTFYFIPLPSPDASERAFESLNDAQLGNLRETDDDRDGHIGEDPPDDLNGDRFLTQMRIEDPTGEWITHPDDARLMIKAERSKGEVGKYRLLTEGIDNDGDDKWNEDAAGGVNFNRNFTFKYPYFKPGAGPHQVSEPECREVADFAFEQPNIYLVLSIAPQDNLIKAWASAKNEGRVKTTVQKPDVEYFKEFAKLYGEQVKGAGAPGAGSADGSFVHWAYFHYGRWSLATPAWWIPKVETKPKDEPKGKEDEDSESDDKTAEEKAEEQSDEPKEQKKPDPRAANERNALAWLAKIDRNGFADWQTVEHPDFAGKKVEVGGFKPMARELPPHDAVEPLVAPHVEFLISAAALRPQLDLVDVTAESLGSGVFRIEATAINNGKLPTMSAMGNTANQLQKLELSLEIPKKAELLAGTPRYLLPVLASHGGNQKRSWLVRLPNGSAKSVVTHLHLGAPSMGHVSKELTLDVNQ